MVANSEFQENLLASVDFTKIHHYLLARTIGKHSRIGKKGNTPIGLTISNNEQTKHDEREN